MLDFDVFFRSNQLLILALVNPMVVNDLQMLLQLISHASFLN